MSTDSMDPKFKQQLYIQNHKKEIIIVASLFLMLLPIIYLIQSPATFQQRAAVNTNAGIPGDLDGNNILNSQDYKLFTECYNDPKQCDKEIYKKMDMDHDGKVNGQDYNLFINALNNKTP